MKTKPDKKPPLSFEVNKSKEELKKKLPYLYRLRKGFRS